MNTIYAPKPFTNRQTCTKILVGNYEVSISMDDSCGMLKTLSRTEIKVFQGDEEVTNQFWLDDDIAYTAEHLIIILNRVQALQEKG